MSARDWWRWRIRPTAFRILRSTFAARHTWSKQRKPSHTSRFMMRRSIWSASARAFAFFASTSCRKSANAPKAAATSAFLARPTAIRTLRSASARASAYSVHCDHPRAVARLVSRWSAARARARIASCSEQ